MNKQRNIFVIVLVLGGLVLLVWNLLMSSPRQHWHQSYQKDKLHPYDLKIFFDLLDSSTTAPVEISRQPLSVALAGRNDINYLFVNDDLYLDSTSTDTLISFIKRGNDALIVQSAMNYHLMQKLFDTNYGELYINRVEVMTVSANFNEEDQHRQDPYVFTYRNGKLEFIIPQWSYYTYEYPENDIIVPLGYFRSGKGYVDEDYIEQSYDNFIYLPIGKGRLFLMSTPLLLTNYFISEEQGFEYASAVLQYLNNKPIVWDDYHHRYYPPEQMERYPESPLKYIFSQPALRYAWYTLVGSFLLFLFFRSKREQRIIPLQSPVENTSTEFAKSLGALYHQANSPKYIAHEMLKMFDNFNRRKFNIDRKPKDPEMVSKLVLKTKADQKNLEKIFLLERQIIYNPHASMKEIIPLHEALEEYYQKTKK